MIPIQEPIREQYFAGKNVCSIHQNYIALISLAITSVRSYSGVVVIIDWSNVHPPFYPV